MIREFNLVESRRSKKKRFGKKNRSPINLGMIVKSPNLRQYSLEQNRHKLKLKNTKPREKKLKLNSKSPVHNLRIKSPVKDIHKQNKMDQYVKVTKKIKNKSYKRFNTRVKKNHYTKKKVDNNFKKVSFNFCKNLYETDNRAIFNLSILDRVQNKLDHYKNLDFGDRYICAVITENVTIKYSA